MNDLARWIVCAAFGVTLVGCVAIDSRVKQEPPANDSLDRISGRYRNEPTYKSQKAGFTGMDDLGQGLGITSTGTEGFAAMGKRKAETVTLQYSAETGLRVILERNGQAIAEQTISPGPGLRVEQQTLIFKTSECGGGLGLGCGTNRTLLFVNSSGDLVVVDSGGGAGLVTLVPFAMYAKLMSIFPRIR